MLTLVGANLNYSSWTIRAWLALKHAGLPFRFHDVGLKTSANWKDKILSFSGAGKVPILIDGSLSVHESLAIGEYVSELAPTANLWPGDLKLRARGRAISCEMLSSFTALRTAMPCNLRARAPNPNAAAFQTDAVQARHTARERDLAGFTRGGEPGRPISARRVQSSRLHVFSGGDALPHLWCRVVTTTCELRRRVVRNSRCTRARSIGNEKRRYRGIRSGAAR